MGYRAAIFDMDGTILDTTEDLKDAVIYAMGQMGVEFDLTTEDAGILFGSGVNVALTRAFALAENIASGYELLKVGTEVDDITPRIDMEKVERAVKIYRPYYASHNDIKTKEYPGITELLKAVRKMGIKTAVVSNKPHDSVVALSDSLFSGLFDISIGEKEGIKRKPEPDMVWNALEELGVKKEEAVYIGDSEIDLQTALNSGMDLIAVDWGFRPYGFLKEHGAETIVSSTDEVLELLK